MLVDLDDDPDVAALIPTLGRQPDGLAACLESLAAQQGPLRIAVLCIVNSDDADLSAALGSVRPMTVVRPGINLGWSGALAYGRSRTTAPLLWLVQDDMVPDESCLAELAAELDRNADLAMVAPLVVVDGVVPMGSCGGVLTADHLAPADVGMDYWLPREDTAPADLDWDELAALDYIPSRGTLIRASVWDEVGGMDPAYYPVQWADVDLCTAVRRADRGFALVASATTQHTGKGSTPGYFALFLGQLHRIRFAEKWFGAGVQANAIDPAVSAQLLQTVAEQAASKLSLLALHVDQELRAAAVAKAETARLRAELVRANEQLSAVLWSRSWRATAALRRVGGVVRTALQPRGKMHPSR